MRSTVWIVMAVGLASLACGGAGAPEAAKESEVAFTTYEAGGTRIVFTTKNKAKKTWRNMSGSAVTGTYTHVGPEIEVQWDPEASNHGSLSEKFQQMGPCSMARYERLDKENVVHDDDPKIFEQKKPKCDTVKLR